MRHGVPSFIMFSCSLFLAAVSVSAAQLSLEISLDKPAYVSGEPILVTSRLTNLSGEKFRVREPITKALVVTFVLVRTHGGKQETISTDILGAGKLAWEPGMIELNPGVSAVRESELPRPGDYLEDTEPGGYTLQGIYHGAEHGTEAYGTDLVLSPVIQFEVKARDQQQQLEWTTLHQFWSAETKEEQVAILEGFLRDHPGSLYQTRALMALMSARFGLKDDKGLVAVYRRLRQMRISAEYRSVLFWAESESLKRLGDTQGAINAITNCSLPVAQRILEELRRTNSAAKPHD